MHGAVGVEFPDELSVFERQAVERAVVGADDHSVVDDYGRGFHFSVGGEGPQALASPSRSRRGRCRRDRRRPPCRACTAGDDSPIPSFTLYFHNSLPSARLTRDQVGRLRADIHDAIGDRRRGFDRIAGVEGPEQLQRSWDGRRRDASEARVAAELRPFVGGEAGQGPGNQQKASSPVGRKTCVTGATVHTTASAAAGTRPNTRIDRSREPPAASNGRGLKRPTHCDAASSARRGKASWGIDASRRD